MRNRKTRRLLSLGIVFCLMLSMALTAFAAEPEASDETNAEPAPTVTLTLQQGKASSLGSVVSTPTDALAWPSGLNVYGGDYMIYRLVIKNDTDENLEDYTAKISLPMLTSMRLVAPLGKDTQDGNTVKIPVKSVPAHETKSVIAILYAPSYKLPLISNSHGRLVTTTHTNAYEVHAVLEPNIQDESTDMTGYSSNTVKTLKTSITVMRLPSEPIELPRLKK